MTLKSERVQIGSDDALCCFNDTEKLERVKRSVDSEHLAVSHTWGEAEWQLVLEFDFEVLASKGKTIFVGDRLLHIVGSQYFWMDILCIDQRDRDARMA